MDKDPDAIHSPSDLHGRNTRFRPRTNLPIRVCSGGNWQDGRVLNLSERGAFLRLDTEVWKGEEVKLVLELPETPAGHIELRALTVWETSDKAAAGGHTPNGYGVLFRNERGTDSRIHDLIQHLVEAGQLVAEEE